MCGIIGYAGKEKKASNVLITGLKNLEYRGYDSSGIAYLEGNINIIKSVGKISDLELKIKDKTINSNLGIGHTRWATHGEVNENNSHPHHSGKVTLVHNGIIENYLELKNELLEKGTQFYSDTDTEVISILLNELLKKDSILESILKLKEKLYGSYALLIMIENDDNLYAIRKDSPLIIGIGKNDNFVASDILAISEYTKDYYLLDENEIAIVNSNYVNVLDEKLKKVFKKILHIKADIKTNGKGNYDHYMLKEIMEEPELIKNFINNYAIDVETYLKTVPNIINYKSIDIVACGSAYYAGLIGKNLIEKNLKIPVNVEVASEYRYKTNFFSKDKLVILISQSGETADTIACMRLANDNKVDTLGIVNVESSTIAREAKNKFLIHAGTEIAVATTKAYVLQVLSLIILSLKRDEELKEQLTFLKAIPNALINILSKGVVYKLLANELYNHEHIFFIGRGLDYAMSLEGSLKLKEISYIHSEAYQAGELKHGTISLIEKDTPVIAIITENDLKSKTISNIKETKARGAKVILIISKELDEKFDFCDFKILTDNTNFEYQPLLVVPILQLISYEIAKKRKCDIDKPRNLAKSVTVE